MAKINSSKVEVKLKQKPKVSRPGIHAKTKVSNMKQSKNYSKLYKGQGK
jgi:hypothetical protein